MPITRQKSPVFSIVSLPTDSVIVDHAVLANVAENVVNSSYTFSGTPCIYYEPKWASDSTGLSGGFSGLGCNPHPSPEKPPESPVLSLAHFGARQLTFF
jgi:hypothetical protein